MKSEIHYEIWNFVWNLIWNLVNVKSLPNVESAILFCVKSEMYCKIRNLPWNLTWNHLMWNLIMNYPDCNEIWNPLWNLAWNLRHMPLKKKHRVVLMFSVLTDFSCGFSPDFVIYFRFHAIFQARFQVSSWISVGFHE